MDKLLRSTQSLCPECLAVIDAQVLERDGQVFMTKTCQHHGEFSVLVWQDSGEKYNEWIEYGNLHDDPLPRRVTPVMRGCPYDCGFCEQHGGDVCSAALMTTNQCDVACPICFTKNRGDAPYIPPLNSLLEQADYYRDAFGAGYPLELCGGEPTTRDDLPCLIAELARRGFDHIQLNTNGLRLSRDKAFLLQLREAGASVIYLGFDGFNEAAYQRKYGRNLLQEKLKAVEHCADVGIAVVLVPVVMPGVNDDQLGQIIQFAKEHIEVVRGIHFQPVSYFGTYPGIPNDADRITIPEVLRKIERQTDREVCKDNFLPAGCEHPLCSFTGMFLMNAQGRLRALSRYQKRADNGNAAERVRQFTKQAWKQGKLKTLSIGGMAFQDVYTLDLERLRMCRIGIIGKDQRMIPLCAKYVTSRHGQRLYDHIC